MVDVLLYFVVFCNVLNGGKERRQIVCRRLVVGGKHPFEIRGLTIGVEEQALKVAFDHELEVTEPLVVNGLQNLSALQFLIDGKALEEITDLTIELHKTFVQQVVFGSEVLIDDGVAHAYTCGDLAHGKTVQPDFGDDLHCFRHQRLLRGIHRSILLLCRIPFVVCTFDLFKVFTL